MAVMPEEVASPVSGRVVRVNVKPGDKVDESTSLLVVEAMKMEIDVPSPKSGTIAKISVATNQAVQEGQILALVE